MTFGMALFRRAEAAEARMHAMPDGVWKWLWAAWWVVAILPTLAAACGR